MAVSDDDWRLMGQERYLLARVWTWKNYKNYRVGWDHDHCEFCGAKFMQGSTADTLHEGYVTGDDYHWVCAGCFEEFRVKFRWKVGT